ncbi:MAG TPA: efflux RND transporter periplasmic adaptor subunit [Steroidobacteraceae bacterium]|nr:efflux RND transporter periplasmic adaptor subunit [Steroidobacteraceae bacterium]
MNANNHFHRIAGVLLLSVVLGACSKDTPSESVRAASDDTPAEHAIKHTNPKYRCPMHPQIVRDEPGQCPICGMNLVEFEPPPADGAAPAAAPGQSGREVRISPAVINNLGVRTEAVVRGSANRGAHTVGYVQFDERRVQQVRPRAEGWVEGLSVRAMGETVQKGELLFTLYSPMLESAQQEYIDALKIGNEDLIAASRDRLRALGLGGTAAQLGKTGRTSGRVAFYAPISGVVTELEAREGAMLSPDMIAMTITELGSLWVMAEVPESQAGWVRPGTHAMVRFPSLPGETLHGSVDYVYPELNMETRTLRARITLADPPAGVKPNMLANIELIGAGGAEGLSIPRSALIRSGTQDRVVVSLGEGRFASRKVVAGAESGDRIAIVEGLQEGELVVTSAQFLLDSEANLDAGLERLESPAEGGAERQPAPAADPHAAHRGG